MKNQISTLALITLTFIPFGFLVARVGLPDGIQIALTALSILLLLAMITVSLVRRGKSWRLKLSILGAHVSLTGITYGVLLVVGTQQRATGSGLLGLGGLLLFIIFAAHILRQTLPKWVKTVSALTGIAMLLVGSFVIFQRSSQQPLFVLIWCSAIIALLSVSLFGHMQDILASQSTGDRHKDSQQVVALASGAVFTLLALFPVIVISINLFNRVIAL